MINRESLAIRRKKGVLMCKRWHMKRIDSRMIGMAGTTPVPCSCWICGNPRRNFRGRRRLTLNELREFQEGTTMREIIGNLE